VSTKKPMGVESLSENRPTASGLIHGCGDICKNHNFTEIRAKMLHKVQ